jgi:hypothetical protein
MVHCETGSQRKSSVILQLSKLNLEPPRSAHDSREGRSGHQRHLHSLRGRARAPKKCRSDLPNGTVLDGGIVALNENGRPSFDLLQGFARASSRPVRRNFYPMECSQLPAGAVACLCKMDKTTLGTIFGEPITERPASCCKIPGALLLGEIREAFRGMRSFTALLWSRRSGYEID